MWSNLLLLLAKCQKPGCGAAVLPDNMKVIRNGIKNKIFIQLASIQTYQVLQLKLFQLAMMDMKRSGQVLSLSLLVLDLFHWSTFSLRAMPFSQAFTGLNFKYKNVHFDANKIVSIIQAFCDKIGLLMISTSTYYRYLLNVIYRCTYEFWLREQAQLINRIVVRLLSKPHPNSTQSNS